MQLFDSFPGDDPVALDAAARALLTLPLEWTASQIAAEPACVHDHWGGTHTTVAFVRPGRAHLYIRCAYASDQGVYERPEFVADTCRRAAARAFVERFAHTPSRVPKVAYTPMIEARMAPMRPGRTPIVLARGLVCVGDDPAAVLVVSAPEFVFGRHARALFGPLVVAVADIECFDPPDQSAFGSSRSPLHSPAGPPVRECVFAGCADDADDYALAELIVRLRQLAVSRAGGRDVRLCVRIDEPASPSVAPRPRPLERAAIAITAVADSEPVLVATAAILPLEHARAPFNDLLCASARPASVPLDTSTVLSIDPL